MCPRFLGFLWRRHVWQAFPRWQFCPKHECTEEVQVMICARCGKVRP